VKNAPSPRLLLILLALVLTLALVACERPLNEEEEPTATPETPTVPEETQPEAATPAPGTDETEAPSPDQPAPEGEATTPAEGETTPEQPAPAPEGGETTTEGGEATPAEPAPVEQPTTAPAPVQPAQPGVEQSHTVQSGENLYRIGLRYGCSVLELSTYNGIANPHWISVGQVIRIPATCGG